jgi:hypothetical protein
MKHSLVRSGLVLALICPTVQAAGPYDGIYLDNATQTSYLTIYQSQTTVITTLYTVNDGTGISFTTAGGVVAPAVLDVFTVRNGTISGSNATISGFAAYRACNVTLDLNFFTQGVNAVFSAVSASSLGILQGYNCNSAYPIGSVIGFTKIL